MFKEKSFFYDLRNLLTLREHHQNSLVQDDHNDEVNTI